MPTLPIIQDSQQLQVGSGRQRVQASPDEMGGLEARALGGLAESVGRAAQTASRIDDDFNEANALELDNQLSARLRDRFYNPENGYLSTQRGRNALDTRAQVEADIDAYINELAPQARNERAQAMFAQVAGRRRAEALGSIATYAAQQNTVYQNEVSEARINEAMDNMVAAYDDPAQVQANRDTGLAELQRLRERNGWDDEILNQRIRQFQSDASSRVIVQLAQSDPQAAQEYFARIAPTLTAQDRAELGSTMRAAIRLAEADMADEAWVYVSENRPIPQDLWARLPGSVRIDIQRERRIRAEGGAGTGDRALISDLNVMAVANPQGFSQYDLRGVRSRLGESAYQSLAEEQARIRNGGARQGASEDTLRSARRIAQRQLRVAGFNVTSDGNPSAEADADEVSQQMEFESDLIGLLDRFVAENNGRQPNAMEQQTAIQNLLTSHASDPTPGLGWDRREWRAFETYTPYSQIPQDVRTQIEARLRARNMPASRGDVERAYELTRIPEGSRRDQ